MTSTHHATRVFAPASIGNVSLGFDVLGAALKPVNDQPLGDYVSITQADQDSLKVCGKFADKLPPDPQSNIVTLCLEHFRNACAAINIDVPPCALTLEKNLPIGSGLGSSAASIVAAFGALNAHFDNVFDPDSLLKMMGECEGQISGSVHYDNVAPSYLGGMTLMTGLDSPVTRNLPILEQWYWTVCYSGISVSTSAARKILPETVPRATTLQFGRQLAVFVDALYNNNENVAAEMVHDVIAEPHRQVLLPGFAQAKSHCMKNGALAFGISGSGPTVFAISNNQDTAQRLSNWLSKHYVQNETGFSHVCQIPDAGIVINKHPN